ncbi:nuclease-related domain-containing protein [Rhodopila globiformis]|uniref:NERD domain-containing protein n=1 Tax=Rhodopila globiformis TaxID=1071 RepID=A0A2S6NHU3_RHOGL|nr:nuclease-related domain-containing protein [Rhodopila globiformis]PPQ34177.1 hypothetical protein CCS01_12420 [Rhodopila globiformis]
MGPSLLPVMPTLAGAFQELASFASGRATLVGAALLAIGLIVRWFATISGRSRPREQRPIRVPARQELGRPLWEQDSRQTQHTSELRAQALGRLGEGLVTAELETGGWPMLRNVILSVDGRTAEIDHAIRVPDGIILLEVKTFSGFITGTENDLYWMQHVQGRTYRFLNPVRQNMRHVRALTTFIDDPTINIRGLVVSAGRARFCPELTNVAVPLALLRRVMDTEASQTEIAPSLQKAWTRLEAEALLSPSRRDDHIRFARTCREAAATVSRVTGEA